MSIIEQLFFLYLRDVIIPSLNFSHYCFWPIRRQKRKVVTKIVNI